MGLFAKGGEESSVTFGDGAPDYLKPGIASPLPDMSHGSAFGLFNPSDLRNWLLQEIGDFVVAPTALDQVAAVNTDNLLASRLWETPGQLGADFMVRATMLQLEAGELPGQ